LKKNTILVVEDEENLLAAIKYNLDNEGYLSIQQTMVLKQLAWFRVKTPT